jgi:Ca2+-binding RTX toxin-like protein
MALPVFTGTNAADNIGPGGISPGVIADPPGTVPGPAADTIYGGGGPDVLTGGGDNDIISGGADNDVVTGNMGNDTLFGDAGDDTISGNMGDDTIFGGDGKDTITGGPGIDELSGGLGADPFIYTTLTQSVVTTGIDTITDFVSGEDQLKIGHTIPPGSFNTGNAANAAFSIIGSGDLGADLLSSLGPANLLPNGAAQVQITTGTDMGNYVVINDGTAGYSPDTDAVVSLLGGPVLKNTDFTI